jgi:aryl-alcohol dehydrogenase-like predicted oxidoreductase
MRRRQLFEGGPEVGAVGLGCMGMSWAYSPEERDDGRSIEVIRAAVGQGVTLIDTADVYGPFHNEELVGEALAGLAAADRAPVVLATKGGLVADGARPGKVPNPNGRPEHLRQACEQSLKRLRLDVIDLYQLHRVDPAVPLAESWGAMAELAERGLVKAIGLSEVTVEQLDEAAAIHPVATVQSELSIWTRDPLDGVLPWCEAHGAGFIPFAPLGRGFLTGAVSATTEFDRRDFRAHNPRFTPEARDQNTAIVDAVRAVADAHGATPAQVALAWVLAQGPRVVPIPGTKRRERMVENAGAADLDLTPDELARLTALPSPAGARY